jgi:hypothetical protein
VPAKKKGTATQSTCPSRKSRKRPDEGGIRGGVEIREISLGSPKDIAEKPERRDLFFIIKKKNV